jgi:hypothetical protein
MSDARGNVRRPPPDTRYVVPNKVKQAVDPRLSLRSGQQFVRRGPALRQYSEFFRMNRRPALP